MEDILVTVRSEQAVTTSLKVAEVFHKRHDHVVRDVEELLKNIKEDSDFPEFGVSNFGQITYTDSHGRIQKAYWMNELGFNALVMRYTGKKALNYRLAYIQEFERMKNILLEKNTDAWMNTRKAGKLSRKSETDAIKQLVEYAKEQGSNHADMLYMTYSKLANKAAGLTAKRELADTVKLNTLSMVENIVIKMIRSGMEKGDDYKKIYQDTKARLEQFKQVAFLQEGG